MADLRVLNPEALAQAERLREVTRGHLDLVPVGTEHLDHRTQHQHMRRVGEVDPNSHDPAG
jgi:hypothetical protein